MTGIGGETAGAGSVSGPTSVEVGGPGTVAADGPGSVEVGGSGSVAGSGVRLPHVRGFARWPVEGGSPKEEGKALRSRVPRGRTPSSSWTPAARTRWPPSRSPTRAASRS